MRTNGMLSMRPLVVLAIRVMAPGPRRIQMVKLAHHLNDHRGGLRPFHLRLRVAAKARLHGVAPSQRAA